MPPQVMQTFLPLQSEQVNCVSPSRPGLPPVPLHFGHLPVPLHVEHAIQVPFVLVRTCAREEHAEDEQKGESEAAGIDQLVLGLRAHR